MTWGQAIVGLGGATRGLDGLTEQERAALANEDCTRRFEAQRRLFQEVSNQSDEIKEMINVTPETKLLKEI